VRPPSARATLLDPGKPSRPHLWRAFPCWVPVSQTPSRLRLGTFEADRFKRMRLRLRSRVSLGTLLDRSFRPVDQRSTASLRQQPSVLGGWLNFPFHRFRIRTPEHPPPDLGDSHPRRRTTSPSAPALCLQTFCFLAQGQIHLDWSTTEVVGHPSTGGVYNGQRHDGQPDAGR